MLATRGFRSYHLESIWMHLQPRKIYKRPSDLLEIQVSRANRARSSGGFMLCLDSFSTWWKYYPPPRMTCAIVLSEAEADHENLFLRAFVFVCPWVNRSELCNMKIEKARFLTIFDDLWWSLMIFDDLCIYFSTFRSSSFRTSSLGHRLSVSQTKRPRRITPWLDHLDLGIRTRN